MDVFEHSRLRSLRSIRLLRILPLAEAGHRKPELIRCELPHIGDLSRAPLYKAISYTWGSTERYRELMIDGKRFPVTRNCYNVLAWLAAQGETGSIWIDYIYIDQSSEWEKSAQVQLMGEIFRTADSVIGFLDAGERYTDERGPVWVGTAVSCFEEGESTVWEDPQSPVRGELEALVGLRYWRRLWIVQECILARNLIFMYAGTEFSAMQLYKVLAYATRGNGDGCHLIRPQLCASAMTLLDSVFQFRQKFDFEQALILFHTWECTDPRDRIFGLSAIIQWPEDAAYQVDYSKSTQQVACEAAKFCSSGAGGQALLRALHSHQPPVARLIPNPLVGGVNVEAISTAVRRYQADRPTGFQILGQAEMIRQFVEEEDSVHGHQRLINASTADRLDVTGKLLVENGNSEKLLGIVQKLESQDWLGPAKKMIFAISAVTDLKANVGPYAISDILTPLSASLSERFSLAHFVLTAFGKQLSARMGAPGSNQLLLQESVLTSPNASRGEMLPIALGFLPLCTNISRVETVAREFNVQELSISDKIKFANRALQCCFDGGDLLKLLRLLSFRQANYSLEMIEFLVEAARVLRLTDLEVFSALLDAGDVSQEYYPLELLVQQRTTIRGEAGGGTLREDASGSSPQRLRFPTSARYAGLELQPTTHMFRCAGESFTIKSQHYSAQLSAEHRAEQRGGIRLTVEDVPPYELRYRTHTVGHVDCQVRSGDVLLRIDRRTNRWTVLRKFEDFDVFQIIGRVAFDRSFAAGLDRRPRVQQNTLFELYMDSDDLLRLLLLSGPTCASGAALDGSDGKVFAVCRERLSSFAVLGKHRSRTARDG